MNLFKRPKYLLMILLASISLATFAPHFAYSQSAAETRVQVNQATGNTGDNIAKADDGPSWIAVQLGHVVYQFTIRFPSVILFQEIKLFRLVGTYNGFTTEPQVVKAWSTVRDLANMFFILILLLMSFGTILQISGYGYRQLLSRLLLMAILINFSKSIVAILIDFSQIITLTFLAPVFNNIGGNLEAALGLSNIMQLPSNPSGQSYQGTSFLSAMILGGIMMIITTVIIGVILAMFLMRVVAFWIMVILSPMAYLAKAFPKTTQYYSQWEGELSSNLTLGPGLAFFIWLAFSIVGQGNINSSFSKDINNKLEVDGLGSLEEDTNLVTSVSKAATTANLLNFVVGISLLMAGLKFAAGSKAVGASFAGKASGSLQKWGSRIGRGATVGAAVGAGALAWRGTSGEGGVKGGLGQMRGLAGQGLANTGNALGIGGVERLGMRQVARENARKQRKEKYVARGAEGMTPEQAEQYYRSFGTSRLLPGSREGQNLLYKNRLKRGLATADLDPATMTEAQRLQTYNKRNAEDISQEEVNQMKAQRHRDMEQSFIRSGDNESLQLLRKRSGVAHDAESVREQVSEQGHKSLSSVDFSGAEDEVLDSLLELTEKELTDILEGMNDQRRDSLMRELERYKHQLIGRPGADLGNRNSALGKLQLVQGKFANNRTGMIDRAATTDRNGNAIGAATHSVTADYQALINGVMFNPAVVSVANQQAQADRFMTNYMQSATGAQIARINRDHVQGNTAFYDHATGRASETVINDVLRAPATANAAPAPYIPGQPPISRRETIARNQVANGNVGPMLNNNQTMHFVSDADVNNYILEQRAAGRTNEQIARQIPSHAHLAFNGVSADFARYVLTLNKTQLGKLDPEELRIIKAHPIIQADAAKLAMINDVV